ncbi:SURF1 family protein [Georgenia sp. 311]|uniref:SURF1 family cytochrome oxidase biogenesis protein n=1 Tax=Georgenia sp. 311 TaxID=2585134 RepID=UPI001111B620|nr:SURF1 family protein [Georgenia sp. 311]TNC17175.1 SURF1 family protein [Georgenia sp. 311]
MSRWAFLRTRRWLGVAAIAVVVATACVLLGRWQLDRHETRAAANDLVTTNYDLNTAPLADVADGAVPADAVWRSVALEGSYVGEQVTVRNRPVDGNAAARVLALLRTDDGGLVVVDRGWLPLGDGAPVPPPYPADEVDLVGRVRQAESPDARTAPEGQVYSIDPATVAAAAGVEGADLLDGYVMATSEDGAAPAGLHAFPRPGTTPGSHLSYAFQWWVFAVGTLVGFVVLARREAAEGSAPAQPARPSRRRTDADEEDALIEAQLRQGPPVGP